MGQEEYDINGAPKVGNEGCGCQKKPDVSPQGLFQQPDGGLYGSLDGRNEPQSIRLARATQSKAKPTPKPKTNNNNNNNKPPAATEQIVYLFPLQIFYIEEYLKNKVPPRYASAPLHPPSLAKSSAPKGKKH